MFVKFNKLKNRIESLRFIIKLTSAITYKKYGITLH